MYDMSTWIKVVGGIIAILSTLVALVVYFTKLKLERDKKLLDYQSEVDTLRSTIAALESSIQALSQSLIAVRKRKDDAINMLDEINKQLRETRELIGATADSILIKNPFSEEELVFLVAHGEAADKIKKMKIPINDSLAGAVYKSGRHSFYPSPDEIYTQHYKLTDTKSGYKSKYVMSIPLQMDNGTIVGVLQLLNKRDNKPFNMDDLLKIEHLLPCLAFRVRALANNPEELSSLGIAELSDNTQASIFFGDITNFGSLCNKISARDVTDLVNEYFDRLCSIGLRYGCTIDKFLGDGFMLRFNIPRSISDYALSAIKCSLAMQKEFATLREEWLRLSLPVEDFSHRIGIATGCVFGGLMGHPQFLSYTVTGNVVNKAARLTEMAREGKILICKRTYELARSKAEELASFIEQDDKIEGTIYEVQGHHVLY